MPIHKNVKNWWQNWKVVICLTIVLVIMIVINYIYSCHVDRYSCFRSFKGFFDFWFYSDETKNSSLEFLTWITFAGGGFFIWSQIKIQNNQRIDGLFRDGFSLITANNVQSQILGIENLYHLADKNEDYDVKNRVANAFTALLRTNELDDEARLLCIYRLFNDKNFKGNFYLSNANLSKWIFIETDFVENDVDFAGINLGKCVFYKCEFGDLLERIELKSIHGAVFIDCVIDSYDKIRVKENEAYISSQYITNKAITFEYMRQQFVHVFSYHREHTSFYKYKKVEEFSQDKSKVLNYCQYEISIPIEYFEYGDNEEIINIVNTNDKEYHTFLVITTPGKK